MRRIVTLTVAALLFLPCGAFGQTTIGVWGGVNRATLDAPALEDEVPWESNTRPVVGLALGFPVSEDIGVRLGASYAGKGGRVEANGAWVALALDFVEFTALADMRIPLGEQMSLHLLAGPMVAFETACELSTNVFGESTESCEGDYEETEREKLDYGVAGGAQLEFALSGSASFAASALYSLGLKNLAGEFEDESVKTRALALQAGFVYSLGGGSEG